jgi:peptidoglycan/LPS O-acetylase OafA/YrhL
LTASGGREVRRLHALTALRFVAAAMIVVGHSPEVKMLPEGVGSPFVLFQAVSFFFVLSGFILTYVYPSLETWEARKRFWHARFARVWPAHAATFFLIIVLLHRPRRLGLSSWWEAAWVGPLNLSLLHSWLPYPTHEFSFNSVSWSVSTELAFYLLFPWLIYRWERTWWWKMLLAAVAAAGMVGLARALRLPAYTGNNMRTVVSTSLVYVNPLARLIEFMLGMVAALAWRQLAARMRGGRFVGTLLELGAFGLVLANMYYAVVIGTAAGQVGWLGEPASTWLVQGGAVACSFAVLVFVMALEWGWLSYALSAPLGILLGEISFSVYLVHQVIMRVYTLQFKVLMEAPKWAVYPVYWALLLVVSHLIWGGFERPMRQRLAAMWPRREEALTKALEKPGGQRHSVFNGLLAPGRGVLVADGVVAGMLVAVAVVASRFYSAAK